MPFSTLQKIIRELYEPALQLRAFLNEEKRELIYKNILIACAFMFALSTLMFAIGKMPLAQIPILSFLTSIANRVYGLFLLVFSAAFVFSVFEAMHRSYYFKGLEQILAETKKSTDVVASWEVATILFETPHDDVTGGFINSNFGQEILYRTGISEELFEEFETTRTIELPTEGFVVERDKGVVLATYARSVYKQDESLRHFLSKHNLSQEHLVRAAEWVTSIERKERQMHRWWSRDNLGKIPGLGKTWSYGPTYLLKRFGHEITEDHIWQTALMSRREEDDEVEELEQILSRNRQSNVLLLTNDVLVARQRVAQLYHKIREGHALPPLEARRVFLVDMESIVISSAEKAAFEASIRQTFEQAVEGGNIILYLENVATAIRSAQTIGVDLVDILAPYFESPEIQIIFGELAENYNKFLARENRLAQAFDVVQMKDVGNDGVIDLLQQRAYKHERYTGIVFTIPAVEKIAEVADRYFPTGVMPDKAFDLLEEMVPYAHMNNIVQIIARDVERFVSKKTNVPIGEPDEQEKKILLSLEDFLHKRVVAQENAVSAVSKALRRSRAGVSNPKKPLGSFLFLGPTGVGKTETAKALAEVLFNDENAMTRLDMSEFQSETAVEELIGFYDTGKPGRLEALVRERQYGVLLLDEFEKAQRSVHDLFLQILDEGHFTNATGQSVNMRNLVIIATSNVGSDMIWQWEKEHKNLSYMKKVLIDTIVGKGLFRPEFLNRFDEIVVFNVLTEENIRKVAEIQLRNFAKRIKKEQQISMEITDELIERVVAKGYDPQFGGRPMTRAIQNEVEQMLADTILTGKLKSGDVVAFHDPEQARHITEEILQDLLVKMKAEHDVNLVINKALIEHIVSQGYDPKSVAGSVRRAVEKNADDFIQKALASGKLKPGDTLEYK